MAHSRSAFVSSGSARKSRIAGPWQLLRATVERCPCAAPGGSVWAVETCAIEICALLPAICISHMPLLRPIARLEPCFGLSRGLCCFLPPLSTLRALCTRRHHTGGEAESAAAGRARRDWSFRSGAPLGRAAGSVRRLPSRFCNPHAFVPCELAVRARMLCCRLSVGRMRLNGDPLCMETQRCRHR